VPFKQEKCEILLRSLKSVACTIAMNVVPHDFAVVWISLFTKAASCSRAGVPRGTVGLMFRSPSLRPLAPWAIMFLRTAATDFGE
jgi:hypothetical protein